MANNKIQIKRTAISGRTPNTTNASNTSYIDAGELAVNLTDKKVYSSNGTASFEVGSNLASLSVGSIAANGTTGTSGQALVSNGSAVYWSNNPGFTGSQGATGPQGNTGPQGIQGTIGFTGSAGAQGTQGTTGFTGSQGAAGSQGIQGFTGSGGATGSTGAAGATGPTGSTGFTGSLGPQGNIGFTGSVGIQGTTGFTGSQGAQGAQGTTGFTGSLGAQGPQGTTGFTGSLGAQGPQGTTGFTGSLGAQGPAGSTGFTGSQGTQGIIGYTGSQGAQGVQGFTGSQGIQGVIGFTGSQGIQGIQGFTGSQGAQGPIGYTGSQGVQGTTGFTGSLGFTGSQGPIGFTGSGPTSYTNLTLTPDQPSNAGITNNTTNAIRIRAANYPAGLYDTRIVKPDMGGGIPLFIQHSTGTANTWTTLARFGAYVSNPEAFRVYDSYSQFDISARSPIFYDSDDTTYYINPANTATSAYFAGNVTLPNTINAGIRNAAADAYVWVDDAYGNFYIKNASGGFYGDFTGYNFRSTDSVVWATMGASYFQHNTQLRSPIYYDSNDTTYYVDANSNSILNTSFVNRYFQRSSGVPTNNLGTPTVTEMALFQEQFDNKTAFYPIANIKFYTSTNGSTWTEYTSFSDTDKRKFVGGNATSNINIPNNTPYFRIEIINNGAYVFLDALYMYWSGNPHSTSVKIKAIRNDDLVVQWTNSDTQIGSWPGHMYLPFNSIPFVVSAGSTGHYKTIHIDFQPTWTTTGIYASLPINLFNMQVWGGYPASKRTIFSVDEFRNTTFPGDVRAPLFYDSDDTGYYIDPYSGTNLRGSIVLTDSGGASPLLDIRAASSSPWALRLYRSDLGGGAQMYARSASEWYHSATITAASSLRAPIFYDEDNTGYYVDPNGTSRLNSVQTVGITGIHSVGSTGIDMATNDNYVSMRVIRNSVGATYNDGMYIGYGNSNSGLTRLFGGGATGDAAIKYSTYMEESGSFRAPVFYDSADTSYYMDPASTTTSIQIAGAVEQGNNYAHPNIEWSAAGSSTGEVIFYLPGTTANYGMVHMVFDIYEYTGQYTATVIIGGHNWTSSWYNTGCNVIGYTNKTVRLGVKNDGFNDRFCVVFGGTASVWSYGQIRLRKIQNGSYYNNVMNLGGNWSAVQTTTETFVNISGDLRNTYAPVNLEVGNIGYAYGSFRAPIFYDYDLTSFYIDPAGTSNINVLQGNGKTIFDTNDSYLRINQINGFTNGIWMGSSNIGGSGVLHLGSNGSESVARVRIVGGTYNGSTVITLNGADGTIHANKTASNNTPAIQVRGANPGYPRIQTYGLDADSNAWMGLGTDMGGGPYEHSVYFPTGTSNNGRLSIGDYNGTTYNPRLWVFTTYTQINNSTRSPLFYDSDNTGYYTDPASTSILVNMSLGGGQTVNGQSHFQWEGATYRNPGDHIPGLLVRADNATAGINGSRPAISLYNENGGDQTTVAIAFVSREAQGSGNAVNLAGIVAKKEIAGTSGNWTDSSLTLYTRQGGTRRDALYIDRVGFVRATVDFRAPIFYDNDNTGFYIDPNSTSQVSGANFNFGATGRVYDDGNFHIDGLSSPVWINSIGNSTIELNTQTSGYVNIGNSARAPIYYDSNNTGYYFDGAGTTSANIVNIIGGLGVSDSNNDPYGKVAVTRSTGNNYTYYGLTRSGQMVYGMGIDTSNQFWIGGSTAGADGVRSGSPYFYLQTNGNVFASGAFLAPIFYDSNDTGYYVDPASTSNLSGLTVTGTTTFAGGSYVASNGDVYARRSSGATGVYYFADGGSKYFYWDGSSYLFGSAGPVTTTSSFRAPIFYDIDNTGYYVDPTSVSNIGSLLTQAAISNNVSGLRNIHPGGGSYVTGASSVAGAIKIKLPQTVYPMMRFTVRVYTYDGLPFDIYCGGHTSSALWYNTFAYMTTQNRSALNVRFTYDGTNMYVMIGEIGQSWAYPQVFITDVQVGYTNYEYDRWDDGWVISFETSTYHTVGSTHQVFPPTSSTNNVNPAYASIFYDCNDSGYYVDPNSVSRMNQINYTAMYSAADGNYGIIGGNGFFDTVNSGIAGDPLELCYSKGLFTSTSGSMRAPLFYDRDDTTFYIDGASTSNISKLRITSAGNQGGGNLKLGQAGEGATKWSYITAAHYNDTSQSQGISLIGAFASSTSNQVVIGGSIYEANPATEILFYTHTATTHSTGGSLRLGIDTNGAVVAQVDMRAPIFYDNNNTGYYFDGNGTSRWATSNQDGYHTFNNYGLGIVGLYASTRFQCVYAMGDAYKGNADGTSLTGAYGLWWSYPSAGGPAASLSSHGLMCIVNGTNVAQLDSSTRANGDMRAPIFYDLNDTFYYTNPNSNSILYKFENINQRVAYDRAWDNYPSITVYNTTDQGPQGDFRIHGVGGVNGGDFNVRLLVDGTIQSLSDVQAPIFYDSNDTGYRIDPTDISRLNVVRANYYGRVAHNTGFLRGGYNNIGASEGQTSPIYCIGSSYEPSTTTLGNMYGIGFTASGSFFPSGASGWGMYAADNGVARIFLGAGTGEITATGNITAYASDRRLKTNITPISNALDKVMRISGVEFDWVDNIADIGFIPQTMHETGVIAQDIQAVIPDAVKTAPFNKHASDLAGFDSNYLTVDKEKIIPLLIEAIKELKAEIEELKAR